MKRQPFFVLLIALILGIIFQEYLNLSYKFVLILLAVNFLSIFLIFIKDIYIQKLRSVFLIISLFCLGIFLYNLQQFDSPKISLNKQENLYFKLNKKLNSTDKNRRYEVTFYKDKTAFQGILTIPKNHTEIDFSHFYKGEVYLQKTEPPYADFIFNYQKYLARKNIFYVAYLPKILEQSSERKVSLLENIKSERLRILNKITASSLDIKSQTFLKGIILADMTEMDAETVADFQNSGLIHLLSISGSHIAIIFGVIYFILLKLFPTGFRRYAILISLAVIWSFALFIGLGDAVVRSCVMISTYTIYLLLGRKPDLLHALSLAGLVILVISPQEIFDIGFQLSFVAVLGIFWFNKPLLKLLPRSRYKAGNFMIKVFTITIAAQISTLPLVLFYFHQFSFVSVIANLIIIPLSEVIIIFSFFLAILLGLNFNNFWINSFYDFVIKFMLKLIHWFAGLDFAMYRNIDLKMPEVILLTLVFLFLGFLMRKKSLKNIYYFSFFVLFFIFVRIITNFNEEKKSEIVMHHFFKNQFLSEKKDNEVLFLISENADLPKLEKYVINPYLTARRCKNYNLKYYPKKTNFVLIGDKKYPLK